MIIITGTPGTGKTKVAKALKKFKFEIVDFKKEVEKCNAVVGFDKRRKSKIIDEEKLTDCFKKFSENYFVVESHLAHFIDPKYVETAVVLKCNPKELRKRLKRRGWSKEKIEENVEAEIMDIILEEAKEMGHNVLVIDTTNKKAEEVAEIIWFNHLMNILQKKLKVKIKVGDPFRTLIRCIISQRTKDETTDLVTERLFKKLKNQKGIAKASVEEIDKLIYPCGFHKVKAKWIKWIAENVKEVPRDREELMKLPGVGEKTADITLSYGFGEPVIAIDVHVRVISERLGITGNYSKMQKKLHELVPPERRLLINKLLVEFGKQICRTNAPKCDICPIRRWCKYAGRNSRNN